MFVFFNEWEHHGTLFQTNRLTNCVITFELCHFHIECLSIKKIILSSQGSHKSVEVDYENM